MKLSRLQFGKERIDFEKRLFYFPTLRGVYIISENLITRLIKENYKIIIISIKDETTKKLKDMGCKYQPITIERRGDKIFSEF